MLSDNNSAIKVFLNNLIYPILVSIGWFFIFQPYLSPIPTGSDLQLFSLLLPLGMLFLIVLQYQKITNTFFWFFLFAFLIEITHALIYGRLAGIYLSSCVFIFFMSTFYSHLSGRFLIFLMIFHCFALFWQTIDSSSFNAVAINFVRDIKYSDLTGRGATGFSAEPSFASILATAYALIFYRYFSNQHLLLTRILFLILYLLALYLTKSATGLIFLPFVLLAFFFRDIKFNRQNIQKLLFLTILLFFTIWLMSFLGIIGGRGIKLLLLLIENPYLFFLDGSLQERFRGLYVGVSAMTNQFYGYGHGNFDIAYYEVANETNLSFIFPNTREIANSSSGLGTVLAGTGIFGLIFYFLIFFSYSKNMTLAFFPYFIFCILLFFFSFSPAFPMIYLPLVLEKIYASTNSN